MTDVTLLEKSHGSFSQHTLEVTLRSVCRNLRVTARVKGITTRGWIQVNISGEDESIALKLLDRELGLAPVAADKIAKFSVVSGKVIDSENATDKLRVDIGVFQPRVFDAFIPIQSLRAQIGGGMNLPLKRLIELFCLYNFMPLQIKLTSDLDSEKSFWEAELSEKQLSRFCDWLRSNLDRLLVLGVTVSKVEEAISKARHFRDVAKIDTFGLFEHAILCKLGTDAAGLMPKLGPHLRLAFLAPFTPRRIREEVKQQEY